MKKPKNIIIASIILLLIVCSVLCISHFVSNTTNAYDAIINRIAEEIETIDNYDISNITQKIEEATGSTFVDSHGSGMIVYEFRYDEHITFVFDNNRSETYCYFLIDGANYKTVKLDMKQ